MRGSAAGSQFSSSLIAFTPRQVLLSKQRNTACSSAMANGRSEQRVSSKSGDQKGDDDSVLTYSVALWLSNKGFSKVLKRFLSAAHIQDDSWKDRALDLNDIYRKYQETVNAAPEDLKKPKKLGDQVALRTDANGDVDYLVSEVSGRKKNKKKKKKSECNEDADAADSIPHEDRKILENRGDQSKKEDKRKSKSSAQSLGADEENPDKGPANAHKTKKKSSDAAENGFAQSEKASKKRKGMASEGNEDSAGNETAPEEAKSKKLKNSKKRQTDPPTTGANVHIDGEKDVLPSQDNLKNLSDGHADENKNCSLTNGDKSSDSKSRKKKASNSAEPKTVNSFQRVKIDDVEFTDDRLQDNSYWAKDGAETGYGAKAQEVLGQVKGRDFRHEKTKKKRGSYRGGQIDLHSHSVKFNYSDDDE